jgi:hypothetical protein
MAHHTAKPASAGTDNGLQGDSSANQGDSSAKKNGHPHSTTPQQPATGWRAKLPIHPAAELLPLMSEDELQELADDIHKNKLREPVTLFNDPVLGRCLLDGRNRLDALALSSELNIKLFFESAPGYGGWAVVYTGDPYAFVISKNIRRRHLSSEQKRELLAKLIKAEPEKSNLQIAKTTGVSDKTVASVRETLERRSEIPNVEKRKDAQGRTQPARRVARKKKAAKAKRQPPVKAPKPLDLDPVRAAWREVEAHAKAKNATQLRASLQYLLKQVERALR